MQVHLLGPVRVTVGGELVALGRKERAVLAALALRAGEVVSELRLVEVLWGDEPPASATRTLRSYVSRLRKALDGHGPTIANTGGGYRLHAPSGAVDAAAVEAMIADARQRAVAGDTAAAAAALRAALDAWDGPSLGGFAEEPWAAGDAARLDELRLSALEDRVEADLACGRHAELVGELEVATATHPYRERLWASRVTALYRAGRQADALRAFADLRHVLGHDLGLDPSPPLLALERQVFDHDPALAAPGAGATPVLPTGVVAFLLTDVVGSTRQWEERPAEMAAAMERHDRLLGDAVAAVGGTLLKSRGEGDATFSVFARASQAARAAAAAQRSLAEEPLLSVRMAIHVGEAVERAGDYYGPTVNRAARLRSIAEGGEVLLSRSAAELLLDEPGAQLPLTRVGERQLKDLSRPETVYRLTHLAADARAAPEEPDHAVLDLPLPSTLAITELVGRGDVAAQIASAWTHVEHGGRRVVLVAGEPGIGKSALAARAAADMHAAGGLVLHGRCDEGLHVPYQPFAEALRSLVDALDPAALRRVAGVGELVRLVPDLGDRVPGLAAPLRADANAERWALFQAVAALLGAVAERRCVLLVIDDLHWAEGATLQLLRHLVRSPLSRLLVVATYRHTDVDRGDDLADLLADLRREPDVDRLVLHGLDEDGMRALVEDRAGEPLGDEGALLAGLLHRETGGNPFFASEVLRHLVETGAVYRGQEGSWTSDLTIDDIGLPESVREVVGRRLSRLSEPAQQALRVAAVAGPTASLRLLEAVPEAAERADDLLDAIDEAAAAGVVVEDRGRFEFAHALIRQALLDQLTSTRRIRLHRRIGEALESLGDHAAHLEALAHHFSEAALDGQSAKAADWCLAAGRAAVETAAHDHAAALFERGLEALESGEVIDRARRCDLLTALVRASESTLDGTRTRLIGILDESLEDAMAIDDIDRILTVLETRAGHYQVSLPDARTQDVFEELLARSADLDPATKARLVAVHASWSADMVGAAASDVADRAVELARHSHPLALRRALEAKIRTLFPQPEPAALVAAADELDRIPVEGFDLTHRMVVLGARATGLLQQGQLDEFLATTALIDDLADEVTGWSTLHFSLSYRACAALIDGRWDDAASASADLLDRCGSDIDSFNVWAAQQLVLHRETGRLEEFLPAMEAAAAASPNLAGLRAACGIAYAETGRTSEALELVTALTAGVPDFKRDQVLPLTLSALAQTAARIGAAESAAVLHPLLLPFSGLLLASAGGTFPFGLADDVLAQTALVLGRAAEASHHAEMAVELADRMRSEPLRCRALRALGAAQAALGRVEDGRASLLAAQRAAIAAGMPTVAADAEALLATLADDRRPDDLAEAQR